MKPSRYNYSLEINDGSRLLFNFYTLALLALKPVDAHLAECILANPDAACEDEQAESLKNLLKQHGFLIDERIDELAALRQARHRSRSASSWLNLTIAPTLACNFACTYCYQGDRLPVMSATVEEAAREFVAGKASQGMHVHVTWYGGEPLLRLDAIERMSRHFIVSCQQHGVTYEASIVTNGYLLDGEITSRLVALGVKKAQVTLDGPPEIHDARRRLRGGGGSFATIWNNLQSACEKLAIDVRMNVDQTNQAYIMPLLDLLKAAGLERKVSFYLGQILPYTEVCADVEGQCISNTDFARLGLQIALEMVQRGFQSFKTLQSRNTFCMADARWGLALTPTGGFVKCWNEICAPGCEVGHLLHPTAPAMEANLRAWQERDPFKLVCAECLILPVCMGGCPYLHRRTGELQCSDWRYHLPGSLLFYYYLKKLQQRNEIAAGFNKLVDSIELRLLELPW